MPTILPVLARPAKPVPVAALSPQDWCRSILASLHQRRGQGRAVGELEMLLSAVSQLDPTIERFESLLTRYAASAQPAVSKAAQVLVEAWWDRTISAVAASLPPLQETLRSLGGVLDDWQASVAYLAIDQEGALLQAFGEDRPLRLGRAALHQAIGARTVLRGMVAPADPTSSERYETRLRVVGADLDQQPAQAYELLVTRRTIVAEGSGGYYRVCTAEGLTSDACAAPGRRHETCRAQS